MMKDSDFELNPNQDKDSNPSLSGTSPSGKKTASRFRMVVSNPDLTQGNASYFKPPRPTIGFFAETYSKGQNVYQMIAQDPSHYLKCNLTLEVMDRCCEMHGNGVICHFGTIDDEAFNEFTEWDEALYGILMVQFQMKIMEELLLFCGDHNASGLVIYADDDQAKLLGIYDSLLVYQEQTLTDLGEKTALIIPAHREAFDKWVDFMEDATQNLQQALWLEQRFNPSVRAYLKSHALLKSKRA